MTNNSDAMSFSVHADGSAQVADKRIKIPNYRIEEYIASGANGVVFRATHEYVSRGAAIKIWTKLRSHDRRDKFRQGIEEARKACAAELIEQTHAVKVFDAGSIKGLFYATMEFVKGVTLASWLTGRPKLPSRWLVAVELVDATAKAAKAGLIHGDLHPNNVLIVPHPPKDVYWMEMGGLLKGAEIRPDIRILDYGTSVFTSKSRSLERHWSVLGATLNRLVSPFSLYAPNEPSFDFKRKAEDAITYWRLRRLEQLEQIREAALYLRAIWAPTRLQLTESDNTKLSLSVKSSLDEMVKTGRIKADEETIGNWYDWVGITPQDKLVAAFDD